MRTVDELWDSGERVPGMVYVLKERVIFLFVGEMKCGEYNKKKSDFTYFETRNHGLGYRSDVLFQRQLL